MALQRFAIAARRACVAVARAERHPRRALSPHDDTIGDRWAARVRRCVTRVALALGCALLLLTSAARGRAQATPQLDRYVVQPGDNCARIARRRYGDAKRYDLIHKYNRLGKAPHHLTPGSVLMLPPPTALGPDAEVTATLRQVQAQAPQAPEWMRATEGLSLYRGWRVNTLERAEAEVTFRDTSALYLRQNTLVVIYGGQAASARRATATAYLERGALRSYLDAQRLQVQTPSSTATLAGGGALVDVDEAAASRLSNFEGGAAKLRSRSGGAVAVQPGYGSKVEKGRRPTPPKPLPPAPAWDPSTPARYMSVATRGGRLTARWQPVTGASAYRVVLSTDAAGRTRVVTARVPAHVTELEAHLLPPGTYYAHISTVDSDRFEGRPSAPQAVQLLGLPLRGPGAGAPAETVFDPGDPSAEPTPPQLPAGSTLTAPPGLRCAGAHQSQPGPAATLLAGGRQHVHCVPVDPAAGTDAPASLAVEVVRARLVPVQDGQFDAPLAPGATRALELTALGGPIPALSALRVEADPALQVGPLSAPARDRLRLPITARVDARGTLQVTLSLQPSSEPGPAADEPAQRAAQVLYAQWVVVDAPAGASAPAPDADAPPTATRTEDAAAGSAAGSGSATQAIGQDPPAPRESGAAPARPAGAPWGSDAPAMLLQGAPHPDLLHVVDTTGSPRVQGALGVLASTGAGSPHAIRAAVTASAPLWQERLSLRAGLTRDLRGAPPLSDAASAAFAELGAGIRLRPAVRVDARVGTLLPVAEGPRDMPRARPLLAAQVRYGMLPWLSLQAHQGLLVDVHPRNTALWSSSYGALARLTSAVHAGLGAELLVGGLAPSDPHYAGAALRAGLGLGADRLRLVGGARLSLTDAHMRRFGRFGVMLSVELSL